MTRAEPGPGAPPVGPRRPRRAAQDWQTSLVLWAATLGALYGMHSILTGIDWFLELALMAALVLGTSAVTRLVTSRAWVPPFVTIVVVIGVITAFFAPQTAFLAVVPTGDTFTAFSRLDAAAQLSISVQTVPATADAGIMFLACWGVAAVAFAADVLAIALRAPALAGLPLLVLLTVPGDVQAFRFDIVAALLTGVCYLLLLRIGSRPGQSRLALGLGAVVVAVTLVLPFALPPVGSGADAVAGSGFGTGVNPVLSLGSDLRQNANHTVLTYSSTSGEPEYLRLVSITDFEGANWSPETFTPNPGHTVNKLAPPPGLTPAIARLQDTTKISVVSLTSKWLPLPYPTSSIEGLVGSWYWDSNGLAVSSPDSTTNVEKYDVSNLEVQPTPAQLQASGTSVPSGMGKYLSVPSDLPDLVRQTARLETQGATTNYQKALALQSYFHDGEFVYSETAPVDGDYDGTGAQVIAKFLQTKEGYCIHFASAMAMMARVLGIPARISVGFLPGTRDDKTGTYTVATHDLHAWPELYFAGVGWVRFEPTVSKGDVPSYATDAAESNVVATPGATDAPLPAPTTPAGAADSPAPSSSAVAQGGTVTASSGTGALWLLLVVVVLLLLAALPGIVRRVQRSRRLAAVARQRAPVLTAWREVIQTAEDVDLVLPSTLTPRDAAAELPPSEARDRLLAGLESERFAKKPIAYVGAAADARTVIAQLYQGLLLRRRMTAVLFPPSIWGKLFRWRR